MKTDCTRDVLTFSLPLSRQAHERAKTGLSQNHLTAQRAKQVYLNALSVYAVEFYLHCMGFETESWGRESSDHVLREFANVADVIVKSVGQFECRPVLPGDLVVQIPLESQCNRRGFFAVQLNADLTEATIIGFLKKVKGEAVPVEEWGSLDDFLKYASHLERAVNLSQWVHHLFEAGWQTAEAILSPPKMAWRSGKPESGRPSLFSQSIERVKRLTFERSGDEIALLVRLYPQMESEMGIGVEVYPTGDRAYLPQDLKLMVLDEDGIVVMQSEARSTKNIQFKFNGETGEGFSVKVALGETSVTEAFTI